MGTDGWSPLGFGKSEARNSCWGLLPLVFKFRGQLRFPKCQGKRLPRSQLLRRFKSIDFQRHKATHGTFENLSEPSLPASKQPGRDDAESCSTKVHKRRREPNEHSVLSTRTALESSNSTLCVLSTKDVKARPSLTAAGSSSNGAISQRCRG